MLLPQAAETEASTQDECEGRHSTFSGEAICDAAVRFLFGVKAAISVWNAWFTHDLTYDRADHLFRIKHSLWTLEGHSYDPPLYYLPAHLYRQIVGNTVSDASLIKVLRFENLGILLLSYTCWIYVIIPRMFRDWRSRTIASVLLLAIPTYQKVAQLAHPDNLHFGLASAAFAFWITLWGQRSEHSAATTRSWQVKLVALAILIGATGMTRPFAAVSVLVLWAATMVLISRRWGNASWPKWRDMVVVSAIAATLSSSWFVYRKLETGVVGGTYNDNYIKKYARHRASVKLLPYFSTFYFGALLREPNRDFATLDTEAKTAFQSKYGNSFPTIAYSEFWGDHWSYFSGRPKAGSAWAVEEKSWPKRVAFVVALPLSVFLALRFFASVLHTVRLARKNWESEFPALVLIFYLLMGSGLFLWWQSGAGMTPGKNSSIKALYNAHLIAPLVLIPLLRPLHERLFAGILFWTTLVAAVSLPLVIFWPQW
jgi:hypothetical protein